jgi:glucose/arabinose dehydrogenase
MAIEANGAGRDTPDGQRSEYRCAGCGYGISTVDDLPACPMCQASDWKPTGRRGDPDNLQVNARGWPNTSRLSMGSHAWRRPAVAVAVLAVALAVTAVASAKSAAPAVTSTGPTPAATVDLPVAGKMVKIGAGVSGVPGLKATLWAHGPKTSGDVTAGPPGSLFVSTAGETGKPVDGVYLVRPGAKPVKVISGLTAALGLAWHDNQLFVASFGRVDVYTDFNGHGFGTHHALLTGLPNGGVGLDDDLRLGPDGRFYMGIASPCDHCAPTKQLSATIVSFLPNGSDLKVFAFGVRGNSSLAFLPGTSELFMATNQRNPVTKSSKTPPDEFDLVAPGSNWGYPWCWQQGGSACRAVSHPLVDLDQHAAVDGLAFIDGQWGSAYGTSAFVSEWSYGKIVRIRVTTKDGMVTAAPQVFLTGVASAGPLMVLPNGSLLVSSYTTGNLYAIHPASLGAGATGPKAATTTKATPASTTIPTGAIRIAAAPSGDLMFDAMTLKAKAGKDTFAFTNTSSVPHNFAILKGGKLIGTTPTFTGGVRLLTVTLAAGTYTFECTVPGHAQAGMKGTLTVG